MNTNASNLITRLGRLGAAPLQALASAGSAAASATADFASLLRGAEAGEVSSGMRVTVHSGAGLELSDDQLTRLSVAADRAESAGMTRAIALVDGQALILEVQTRSISGRVDPHQAMLTGIDGVIGVPGGPGASGAHDSIADLQIALTQLPRVPLDVLTRILGGGMGSPAAG